MIPSPLKRLRIGLVALAVLSLLGVLAYQLAGLSLLDAIYMVAMILSTVGLGEVAEMTPPLKVITTVLMVVGVTTALYLVGGLVQMMAEGEINRALGVRRVTKEIERLTDHVIVCGFGRMGEILADEMRRQKKPFVLLENDTERIAEATTQQYLALNDNATEEEALVRAGVARAATLVTTLPSDAANVFITLTARNLNPQLKIIARGEFPSTEKKLMQAGADHVVLPAATGALRMAAMITRPSAIELIEVVAGRQIAEVEVGELVIPEGSSLIGATVRESQPRAQHGLLIVAMRHPNKGLEFNPGGEAVFEAGSRVIVMGRSDDIDHFRAAYGL